MTLFVIRVSDQITKEGKYFKKISTTTIRVFSIFYLKSEGCFFQMTVMRFDILSILSECSA